MAFPTPASVFCDENLLIHRGKRSDAPRAKALKPSEKTGFQERKALQDVSNFAKGGTTLKDRSTMKEKSQQRKPLQNVTNTIQGTALKGKPTYKEMSIPKERSTVRKHEAINNPVKISADEDTKKCYEWTKDGVEGAQFTGNDSQKLDKDAQDQRVKKKVANVMSALHGWSDVIFDPVMFPATEVSKFFEEVKGLELEPEILPDINNRLSSSGDKAKLAEDLFTDDEEYPFLDNKPLKFELRDDEPVIPGLGVY